MRLGALGLSLAALAAAGCGATRHSSVVRGTPTAFRASCPHITKFGQVRPVSFDQAVAAARRAVVARKTVYYQDRSYRRNNANTPIFTAIDLDYVSAVPGAARLVRLATERCGRLAAKSAWAVEFAETLSPIAGQSQIVFVVRTTNGLKVF